MESFQVTWYDELASTNTFLRERVLSEPGLASGTVVAARCQTAGRGRHDRTWIAGPGRDLAFSFLWHGNTTPEDLPCLPMAASLAVADALGVLGVDARCKWPNDVLARGRKICGILAEFVPIQHPPVSPFKGGVFQTAVVGVGVNVNMTEAEAASIDRPATSVLIETGKPLAIEAILTAILERLPERVAQWEQGGFEGLRADWERYVSRLGLPVVIEQEGVRKEGVLAGFDAHGAMRLRHQSGEEEIVLLGDVL